MLSSFVGAACVLAEDGDNACKHNLDTDKFLRQDCDVLYGVDPSPSFKTQQTTIREELPKKGDPFLASPSFERTGKPFTTASTNGNEIDPDSSDPGLQEAWDLWHKRVATQVYSRFEAIARIHRDKPLACQIGYSITRDGRIVNLRMIQKSPDPMFNSTLLVIISSMKGNPVLQFPAGSKRQIVEKTATFTRNYSIFDPVRPTEDMKTRMKLQHLLQTDLK